jgi:hypothetical protein
MGPNAAPNQAAGEYAETTANTTCRWWAKRPISSTTSTYAQAANSPEKPFGKDPVERRVRRPQPQLGLHVGALLLEICGVVEEVRSGAQVQASAERGSHVEADSMDRQ